MYQPTWLTIPAGTFTMGSDPRMAARPYTNEYPQQRMALSEFHISRVPITNAQYACFVADTQQPAPAHWAQGRPRAGTEQQPVTYVSWHDAQMFCAWAGVRLPTEAEWEKAARGVDGRWWPWGEALPEARHCHFNGQVQGVPPAAQGVMPVRQLPQGASPYGVLDMAGNVWEWTHSLYQAYPYMADDGREEPTAHGLRVVRGGSYNHTARQIRCAARDGMASGVRDVYIGLRVAVTDLATVQVPTGFHGEFDWVTISAGEFVMGSTRLPMSGAALPSELPQHEVYVPTFRLAQTPVTNAAYAEFVQATNYPAPSHWFASEPPRELWTHPVTHVDWYDAQAFCAWAGVRLPTEAEWEKAARGTDARMYPWGHTRPDATRLNYRRLVKEVTTTPVDQYPAGASPYGALDMAGNVWEWVSSVYAPYPYQAEKPLRPQQILTQRATVATEPPRVLRGGSFASQHASYVRCAMRSLSYPTRRREHIGLRVAQ